MKKISHQQVQSLLKTASTTIRAQENELSDLREKIARFEKRERAEKIAAEMEEKGLHADLSFQEKVAHLEQAASLDVTEEAVKLASPQNAVLGSVTDRPGNGVHAFEQYILTGESPE